MPYRVDFDIANLPYLIIEYTTFLTGLCLCQIDSNAIYNIPSTRSWRISCAMLIAHTSPSFPIIQMNMFDPSQVPYHTPHRSAMLRHRSAAPLSPPRGTILHRHSLNPLCLTSVPRYPVHIRSADSVPGRQVFLHAHREALLFFLG